MPLIVGVAGSCSGAGKTTVACEILRRLRGWSAIKYTKTSLYSSIVEDPAILSEKGKDTARMLDAGAEKVLWVQSPPSELPALLNLATGMLCSFSGIIIEGNSAVNSVNPDILVFVSGNPMKLKPGASSLLEKTDILIYDKMHPVGNINEVRAFERADVEGYITCLKELLRKKK